MNSTNKKELAVDFNQEELIRYSRHFNLAAVGLEGQKKLKSARILCIGAGGLGSPLLLYLAAAGIGTLGIVDDDIVDLSNLQRQVLFSNDDIEFKKTQAAKNRIKKLNQNVNVILHEEHLNRANAINIINNYDIIADGSDNFATRYLVNDACFHLNKINVYASVAQFEGQCTVFNPQKGPCYRCLYAEPPPPGLIPNCAEGGVFGVLPGLMGSIQATEIIKLALDIGSTLVGRLLIVDALSMCFQEFKLQKDSNCRLCTYRQPFNSLPSYETISCFMTNNLPNEDEITVEQLSNMFKQKVEFSLIDVREPYEYNICNLGGILIPLAQLPSKINEFDKNKLLILHCKTGNRSLQAVNLLREAGFNYVKHLAGGILAWAKRIDHHMSIY